MPRRTIRLVSYDAVLTDADLTETDLRAAVLSRNLDGVDLRGAEFDDLDRPPPGGPG